MPVTKENYEAGKKDTISVLQIMDAQLKKTPYLAGNDISIADFACFPVIRLCMRLWIDEKLRNSIPNVVQWHNRVHDLKETTELFGKRWLCIREATPVFEEAEKKE